MHGRVLLGDHLGCRRLVGHGTLDRQLCGFVVVLLDLRVVFGQPVNEDSANNHQLVGLFRGNRPLGQAIGDRLGDTLLSRAEHLHGLSRPLDRDLRDHHRRRLDGQVRSQHGQQIDVTGRLPTQGVGEGRPHRTVLVTDQQVNVCNFISIAHQGFANKNRHLGCLLVRCHVNRVRVEGAKPFESPALRYPQAVLIPSRRPVFQHSI